MSQLNSTQVPQEEINFRHVIQRFWKAWPIFLISFLFFGALSVLLLLTFPPIFPAKTTVLIQKPMSVNDPSIITADVNNLIKIDDYFYNNQKVAFRSYPLVLQTVKDLGLPIQYLESGLFSADLFGRSPFLVTIDSSALQEKNIMVPYDTEVEIKFISSKEFTVEGDMVFPNREEEIPLSGTYQTGEWIDVDGFRFKVTPTDYLMDHPELDITEADYSFVFRNPDFLALEFIENMEILQEDVETTAFGVTLSGSPMKKPLDFLNHLGDLFIKDHMATKTVALDKALEFLNDEIATTADKLEASEQLLGDYKTQNEITSLSYEANVLVDQASKYESGRMDYLVKGSYYRYLKEFLSENNNYASLLSPSAFGIDDPLMAQLTSELINLQNEKNMMTAAGTKANPVYNQIESRIASNRQLILNNIEGFVKSNQIMLENIDERIADLEKSSSKIPAKEKALMRLEREYRMYDAFYENLRQKRSEAQMLKTSIGPDFSIIEPAFITSDKPSFPNPLIMVVITVFFGLFFPVAYLLGKSFLSATVYTESDLARFVPNSTVLGTIHANNIRNLRELAKYPYSKTAHEFSILIKKLSVVAPNQLQTIGITAPNINQGDSSLASFLAYQFAAQGYRTLLIDGNFLDPHISTRHFSKLDTTGLANILNKSAAPMDVTQASEFKGLYVLTAGNVAPEIVNLKENFHAALAQFKEHFDKIVVAASPFVLDSFAVSFLQECDYNIISTKKGKTTFDDLESIYNSQDLLAPNRGLVLTNGVFLKKVKKQNRYFRNKPYSLGYRFKHAFQRI